MYTSKTRAYVLKGMEISSRDTNESDDSKYHTDYLNNCLQRRP